MTGAEAKALVAVLAANWPNVRIGTGTVALYARRLMPYSHETGVEAVARVIDNETFWPPFGVIREALDRVRFERAQRQADERGLDEPELTPAQRRENAARMRALTDSIGKPVADG